MHKTSKRDVILKSYVVISCFSYFHKELFLRFHASCVWGVAALCTPFWRKAWTGRAGAVSWWPPASQCGGPMPNWNRQTLIMQESLSWLSFILKNTHSAGKLTQQWYIFSVVLIRTSTCVINNMGDASNGAIINAIKYNWVFPSTASHSECCVGGRKGPFFDWRQNSGAFYALNSGVFDFLTMRLGVVFFVRPHPHNTMQIEALQSQLWRDNIPTYPNTQALLGFTWVT